MKEIKNISEKIEQNYLKDQNEQARKNCENCKYFCSHYVKRADKFRKIECGHCLKKHGRRFKTKPLTLCKSWEEIVISKEEKKESIKKTLRTMSKQLNDLITVFKDE